MPTKYCIHHCSERDRNDLAATFTPTSTAVPASLPTESPTPLPTPANSIEGVIAYYYQPMTGNSIHQIYSINADGSQNHRLINASIGLNHHDWSPNGEKLTAVGYVDSTTWSIHVFNADGSGLIRLTTTANALDSEPIWSPDGSKIVFTRMSPDQIEHNEI